MAASSGRIDSVTQVLRCRDLTDASLTVAALYGVSPSELEQALTLAARQAQEAREGPVEALPAVLAATLAMTAATPARIHYFYGTRVSEADRFSREGLLPLGQVVDSLWRDVAVLVPELSEHELRSLRSELTDGTIGSHTYRLRVNDDREQGPCGHLLRDMFLHPGEYASVDYLSGAEIVIDICQAIEQRTGIDAAPRYREATPPCIVEFSVPTSHFSHARAAALWCLAAGLRGERTLNGNWSYCSAGVPLPAQMIVSVLSSQDLRPEGRRDR
jgi:hypothetical protein